MNKILNRDNIMSEIFQRPWGYYQNLYGDDNGPYKVKKIVVNPKQRLSLQSHNSRAEHWTVVKGNGVVQVCENEWNVEPGRVIYIPKEAKHRMTNNSENEVLEFIEVQRGDYLGEDDITRYEDNYGRL